MFWDRCGTIADLSLFEMLESGCRRAWFRDL